MQIARMGGTIPVSNTIYLASFPGPRPVLQAMGSWAGAWERSYHIPPFLVNVPNLPVLQNLCKVQTHLALSISTPPQEQVVQWRMTVPRKKHLYQAEQSSEMASWSSTQKSPYSLSPIHQLGEFKPGRGLGASGHVQRQRYENVGRRETRPP